MNITLPDPVSQLDHLSSQSAAKPAAFYEAIFESLPVPIVVVNRSGTILHFNSAFRNVVLMRSRKDLVGRNLLDHIILENRERVLSALGKALKTNRAPIALEADFLVSGNGSLPVQLSLRELPQDRKILMSLTDKTLLSKAHAELQQRTDNLENLFFLISHNLKSPIVSIQGFTKLLLEEDNKVSNEEFGHYLQRIQKNAARMNTIVQDILDFSKVGKRSTTTTELSLFDIIENVRAEFFLPLRSKNIDFRVARDLPVVRADLEGISAIFRNLVENAIKYIGETKRPRIRIDWQDKGTFYLLWVKDNGIGIPKRYHDKVFSLFERAAAPMEIEGTGVGLALVKRIVEKYGGQVKLESRARKGTTVYFTLPKADS